MQIQVYRDTGIESRCKIEILKSKVRKNLQPLFDIRIGKNLIRRCLHETQNEICPKRNSVYFTFRCGRIEMKFRYRGDPKKTAHSVKTNNFCFDEINTCTDVSFHIVPFWVVFTFRVSFRVVSFKQL